MFNLYLLLQISLGISSADSFPLLDETAWQDIKDAAEKHAIIGVVWGGIEKLPLEKQPPRHMKLTWMADAEIIKKRNMKMDKACVKIVRILEKMGLPSVILKGQAIAKLYPNPYYRTSGDIDALILPQYLIAEYGDINHSVKPIRKKIQALGKGVIDKKIVYHHTTWRFSDVEIEVHHRSMQLNSPAQNKAYQQWAKGIKTVPCGEYNTADVEYNLVFMLAHIYHHLLFEGVGLRQVCDYAVLLQAVAKEYPGKEERQKLFSRVNEQIAACKMTRFLTGLMWIMQTVFALPSEMLMAKPDETVGRFIMKEIEQAGNFGQHDERIRHERLSSVVGKFIERTKHRMRFLQLFPEEILWDIPFRLWHYVWRVRYT